MSKQSPEVKRARRFIRENPNLTLEKAESDLDELSYRLADSYGAKWFLKEFAKTGCMDEVMEYSRRIEYQFEQDFDAVSIQRIVVSRLKEGLRD